jgi:hypothetical protein
MLDLVSLDTGRKTVAVAVVGVECSKVQKFPWYMCLGDGICKVSSLLERSRPSASG